MPDDEQVRRAEGQINLLLEDRSLRSEITTRIGARMTLLGFLTASAAFLVGDHRSVWAYVLVIGLITTGALVWFRSGQLLGKLSGRLAQLEDELNVRAGVAYDVPQDSPFLAWEIQMRAQRARALRELMS
jgi:hypothetical protein